MKKRITRELFEVGIKIVKEKQSGREEENSERGGKVANKKK